EIMRNRKRRESGDHIDAACARENIDRPSDRRSVQTGYGAVQILPVVTERGAETRAFQVSGDLALVDGIAGSRELPAYQLAHPLLQIRESVETEAISETHDGRRIDVELRGHLIDSRERHRLRMLDDIFGDPLLRLREPVVAPAQFLDHVARTGGVRCGLGFSLTDRHTCSFARRPINLPTRSLPAAP